MQIKVIVLGLCLYLTTFIAVADATKVTESPVRVCSSEKLQAGLSPEVTLTAVSLVGAGPLELVDLTPNGSPTDRSIVLGSHCLIQGRFEERVGTNGKRYYIGFEMRLPTEWNGRLLYQGGGGLNGVVLPAVGRHTTNGSSTPMALARGYAVVSTDSGHQERNANFAEDQLAKINYAYAAIGKVTKLAHQILSLARNTKPERTYFQGCSNGGREALIAAQRYPELFDGIVAGNPAFNLSTAAVLSHYSTRQYWQIAPQGSDGQPVVPRALTESDMSILARGILDRCDKLDGAEDGMVFDQGACDFDPRMLQCSEAEADNCLPAAKVETVRNAFRGPLAPDGAPLTNPWVYDPGVAGENWRAWQIGTENENGEINTRFPDMVADSLARYFAYPALSAEDLETRTSFSVLDAIAPTAAITDATSTQMSTFAAKGGKAIIVTGWSDPIFSAHDLTAWYEKLTRDTHEAGFGEASQFARLFLVPGMNHCSGGPALDDFDVLSVLDEWVQSGKAPDYFIATGKHFPGQSRPICAYPKHAVYSGKGDYSAANNYTCQ